VLQLRDAPVLRSPKGHTPQLGEDGALQSLDEPIRPGVPWARTSVADAQLPTRGQEARLPFGATIGEHRLTPVARPLVARPTCARRNWIAACWVTRGTRVAIP
jgi:hypothetical protein